MLPPGGSEEAFTTYWAKNLERNSSLSVKADHNNPSGYIEFMFAGQGSATVSGTYTITGFR